MAKSPKDKRISAEMKKFKEIFKDIPDNKKELVEGLIQNAAFMRVTMLELQENIKNEGATLESMTGNGFIVIKENPASKIYTTMVSRYAVVIQQLQKLLPSDEVQTDEFFDFIDSE